jgi:hypothetical protein
LRDAFTVGAGARRRVTLSVAAPVRVSVRAPTRPWTIYAAALIFWVLTRLLVLVHQGAWPWMNSFVVDAARGIVVGEWNDAVRPQLPAVIDVPLVLVGATEQQMVAALYMLASLVQFGAFLVLIRALFPDRMQEQTLALLVFLLVPFNHSIHHYRDMPVLLASAAIFLLAADFLRVQQRSRELLPPRDLGRGPHPDFGPRDSASVDRRPADDWAPDGDRALAADVAAPHDSGAAPVSEPSASQPNAATASASAASSWPAAFVVPPDASAVPISPHASPPARPFQAKRNDQASREPSRVTPSGVMRMSQNEEKASRKRHAGITLQKQNDLRHFLEISAILLLGVWSRVEMLTFVVVLMLIALVVLRRRAARLVLTYAAAAAVVTGGLLFVYQLEDVDLSQAWFYTAHTFLDSTPDSWLSAACRADPTENCREADGLSYFGPADLHDGVLRLAMNHPLTTLAKSVRSAWDNAWTLVGPNFSTYPGTIPFVVLCLVFFAPARQLFRETPAAVWVVAVAIALESVLPPLTWAPPHPQYHVALVVPIVILLVPVLYALIRTPRGRWVTFGFLACSAALSAFRYTRYPGY